MFEFGNRFAVLHPKVQFDIPPEPESYELEEYKQWLVKNKPDIVQVPLNLLKPLADEGLLLPLDERIQRDGFALEAFHAPVIQTIREAGAGKLYGFAPYFDTAALYYNRTLFERNGVKLPTDRMSWEDVLRLASRFGGTTEDGQPVYGLTTQDGSPFQLVMTIGETEGLRITGGDDAEPTINTPAWTRITDEVANAYRNGSISVGSNITSSITMAEQSKSSPFLSGRAAMTFMPSYYRSDIIAATEQKLFGDDWGIVTQPVDSRNPDRASQFSLPIVFAITANSPNSEAAWALLQDFLGPEKAEQDAKLGIYRTFARLPDEMDQGPQGNSVFYKLNPDGQSVIANIGRALNEKTFRFEQALVQAGNEELQAVVKGDLSAADALKRLQAEAEAGQFGSAP
ncbi:ABC transporter substrate-binding protein [Cohnella faecalis]|uniref:ABC transporter substrate-binding protein n=1 Tax=Cohnella faecalis TaxID=2315694 RepID=UPI0036196AFF